MSSNVYTTPSLKKAYQRLMVWKNSLTVAEFDEYYSLSRQNNKSKSNPLEIRTQGSSSTILDE
jgi:hypothetical protein